MKKYFILTTVIILLSSISQVSALEFQKTSTENIVYEEIDYPDDNNNLSDDPIIFFDKEHLNYFPEFLEKDAVWVAEDGEVFIRVIVYDEELGINNLPTIFETKYGLSLGCLKCQLMDGKMVVILEQTPSERCKAVLTKLIGNIDWKDGL